MAVFVYRARSKEGKLIQGNFEAETSGEVRAALAGKGYYVVLLKEKKVNPFAKMFSSFNRANYRNLAIMARQLSVLLRSGIAITNALKTLGEQTENTVLTDIISDVNKDVGEGMSLSSAFAKHDDVFPQIFINLVRSGERSGHLDEELDKLSAYLERYYDLERKVKDAFIYPAIVAVASTGVVIFLVAYLVPVFSQVYKNMGLSLPLPTILLIKANNFLRIFWWLVVLIVAGAFIWVKNITRFRSKGIVFIEYIKFRIPAFGKLQEKVMILQFVRTFSTMLSSGINAVESMQIASDVTGTGIMQRFVKKATEEITEGKSLSHVFNSSKIFPPIVKQMISAGEESGHIEETLSKCADFLDKDIEEIIKRLTVIIEPVLTIAMGVVVGFIAIAIYLPMFDLVKVLKR